MEPRTEVQPPNADAEAPASVSDLTPMATPGLRVAGVPKGSMLLLSGLVGLSSGLAGCAGMPLRFQDRLGSELDGYPSWSQIVEAERERQADLASAADDDGSVSNDPFYEPPKPDFQEETLRDPERPANLAEVFFGRRPSAAEEVRALPDEVRLGMTESEVMDAWGEPREVEIAGSIASEAQRFIYPTSVLEGLGEERIIYFENGRVAGWETVRR